MDERLWTLRGERDPHNLREFTLRGGAGDAAEGVSQSV